MDAFSTFMGERHYLGNWGPAPLFVRVRWACGNFVIEFREVA